MKDAVGYVVDEVNDAQKSAPAQTEKSGHAPARRDNLTYTAQPLPFLSCMTLYLIGRRAYLVSLLNVASVKIS